MAASRTLPGLPITYTIVAANSGPSFVTAANVADNVPANITGVTWTAVYSGTGSSGAASGSGNISTAINLAAGGSATFTLSGTVLATSTGNLSNTATVAAPIGFTDTNPSNNSATDTDTPNPIADLAVTKTGPAIANPNGTITYSITVSNLGPSDAQNASLTDPLPAGVTYVSQAQTCGTTSLSAQRQRQRYHRHARRRPVRRRSRSSSCKSDNPSPPGTIITEHQPPSPAPPRPRQHQQHVPGAGADRRATSVRHGFVFMDGNLNGV